MNWFPYYQQVVIIANCISEESRGQFAIVVKILHTLISGYGTSATLLDALNYIVGHLQNENGRLTDCIFGTAMGDNNGPEIPNNYCIALLAEINADKWPDGYSKDSSFAIFAGRTDAYIDGFFCVDDHTQLLLTNGNIDNEAKDIWTYVINYGFPYLHAAIANDNHEYIDRNIFYYCFYATRPSADSGPCTICNRDLYRKMKWNREEYNLCRYDYKFLLRMAESRIIGMEVESPGITAPMASLSKFNGNISATTVTALCEFFKDPVIIHPIPEGAEFLLRL